MQFFLRTLPFFLYASAVFAESDWTERFSLKNDFRFRTELLDQDSDASPPNFRQRLRARLGGVFQVNDQVESSLTLSSGSDDPTSTNQTLGDGSSTKSFSLDEAFAKWKPSDSWLVWLGKTKNIFYSIGGNQLIWDSDLRPEGIFLKYQSEDLGGVKLTLNGGSSWVAQSSSNSTADDSVLLNGLQVIVETKFCDSMKFEFGSGIYDYSSIKNHKVIYRAAGNSVTGSGANATYNSDFQPMELFAGIKSKIAGLPYSVFFNGVKNLKASRDSEGYLLGASLGESRNAGDLSGLVSYRRTESESTFGLYSESDFNNGNLGSRGWMGQLTYVLGQNAKLAWTSFWTQTNETTGNRGHRNQLDLSFQF